MDFDNRIDSILAEYALRSNNEHVGSGYGGNTLYFGYIQNRESVITTEVENVDFTEGKILWNPEFLSKSKSEIRKYLDNLIKDRIEKENFTFSLDALNVDDTIGGVDPERLLRGEIDLPNLAALNLDNKLFLCMRVCASLAAHLDKEDANKYFEKFHDIISRFNIGVSLISIRTQIGIERLVHFNLDEDTVLGPYLMKMNLSF